MRAAAARPPVIVWQPHFGPQSWMLACPVPEILYGGARGGGKTSGALGDFAAHAQRHGKHASGIIFRKTHPELDEVVKQARDMYGPLGWHYQKSERTWIATNGAALKMRHLDIDEDAALYQGHEYTWLCFEEAGNWPDPQPLDRLRGSLRSTKGVPTRMLLTCNPGGVGHHWLKARYVDPAAPCTPFRGADGMLRVFIPAKLSDNPTLAKSDPDYEARLRASGPGWLVAAWLHGDWSGPPSGGYFKLEHMRSYQGAPPDEMEARYLSIDLAGQTSSDNDCTAILAAGMDARGDVWILPQSRVERISTLTSCTTILDIADELDVDAILIEHGQFQIGLQPFLEKEMEERAEKRTGKIHHIEIMPTKTKGATGKAGRAMGLLAMMEQGRWHFPQSELYETVIKPHFLAFTGQPGVSEADDEIDACAHLAIYVNRMLRGAEAKKPVDKTVEREKERRKEMRERVKRSGARDVDEWTLFKGATDDDDGGT